MAAERMAASKHDSPMIEIVYETTKLFGVYRSLGGMEATFSVAATAFELVRFVGEQHIEAGQ
jgi:hypothetical protein